MSWIKIIVILIVVGFATGLLLGILKTVLNYPGIPATEGVGVVVGVTAAFLIFQRMKAK